MQSEFGKEFLNSAMRQSSSIHLSEFPPTILNLFPIRAVTAKCYLVRFFLLFALIQHVELKQIYGMDAASGAAVAALEISPCDHVLDLCAAPGTYFV